MGRRRKWDMEKEKIGGWKRGRNESRRNKTNWRNKQEKEGREGGEGKEKEQEEIEGRKWSIERCPRKIQGGRRGKRN